MRAILFGVTGYGNAALRGLLAEQVEVGLVISGEETEGRAPAGTLLADEARRSGIDVADGNPDQDQRLFEKIRAYAPDLIVVTLGAPKVSTHVAKLGKQGIYLHPSLLPKYRGPAPTNWMLINGEATGGVTLARLARLNDSGDVLLQRQVALRKDEDDGALRARLADEMTSLVREFVLGLRSDVAFAARKQDDREITMYPEPTRRDGHVRFDQGSAAIRHRVFGVTPWPGAYTDFCGVEFDIESVKLEGTVAYDDEPGRVVSVDAAAGEIVVKSMDGLVRVKLRDDMNRLGAIAAKNHDLLLFAGKFTPFSARAITDGAEYDNAMPDIEEFTKYSQFPDMVVLAVAYPCNAHCPNCPYVPENSEIRLKYADAQFIAPNLFMKIADECGEAARQKWLPDGVGSMIRITGGGEPMLHPYGMTKLIEYGRAAGARVYLNTNGSLFKNEEIDRLLACNTDNIEVSVDCADRDTYAIVRKGLDWDDVLASLKYMIERRNATRSLTTIEVSVINQEIVADKIPEIEKFWYDFGVDNVIVRKFLTWGSSTNIDPNESGDPLAYLDRDSGVPCPYPFHRLNVDSRGKVEVCGFDIMGRTNMGNVREQTIREIWQGAMFNFWRKKHSDGQGGDIPMCAECPDWKYRSWEHNYRKALKNAAVRRDEAWSMS